MRPHSRVVTRTPLRPIGPTGTPIWSARLARRWPGTVLVAGLVAAAACGTADDTLSRAEYEQQANAICAATTVETDDAISAAVEDYFAGLGEEPYTPDQLQGFYQALTEPTARVATLIGGMLDDLRELEAPAERSEDYRSLWDDIEATLEHSRADIAAAASDPSKAVALWDSDISPFEELDQRARNLALPDCTLDT